ncbi:sensor histidine kinase [Lyngbya confervoides]|uniref:histidine kinase n=1 Tax=Lyngbya confervoides BDU141951 TaxID=1574623 RepID=A0ABD4T3J9_9CYAN|nr:sensor histidine kinase [Lyngbya confervoides]MCM1982812.1 sensor histidine kinase [Lyngbya confervoides BDU141951]
MNAHRLRQPHPFPLLLYLEWIVLGGALLTLLLPTSTLGSLRPRSMGSPLWGSVGIGLWGILVLGLPLRRSPWKKWLYISLGYGLSWWVALSSSPRSAIPFAAMLLVVVMRTCLLFRWPGRIVTAMAAFGSFLLRLWIVVAWFQARFAARQHLSPKGEFSAGRYRFAEADFQGILLQFTAGSALLYGLVIVFVLLMVGTLVSERQSRQQLDQANHRLRRYALLVENQATLQERNRIAREIHDSIGHTLTAQSIQLENVDLWFDRDPQKARDHLYTSRTLSKEALGNIRQAVASLRQDILRQQSLPEALTDLVKTFEAHCQIPVMSTLQVTPPLPRDIAIALYRITQEALTNISKHAQAEQVTLVLSETDLHYWLEIGDDGQGFVVTENTRGFGLTSMRERVEALNGRFHLSSAPQQGCKIQVEIPYPGGGL